MELMTSSIVRSKVCHIRKAPVGNSFTYGVDYLLLDESDLKHDKKVRFFSFGRPNLVSLYPSDHFLAGDNGIDKIYQLTQEAGISGSERVFLLTHPRYWGYTFNPVSFWLVFNASGGLRAVFAEVHNTFGDHHTYLCTGKDGADIENDTWTVSRKMFHVSPFFDIVGNYRFHFQINTDRIAIRIVYDDGQNGGLATSIVGPRLPFTDRELIRALLRRPLGAARMKALIHWQALRLWKKGVKYRPRPEPPNRSIT